MATPRVRSEERKAVAVKAATFLDRMSLEEAVLLAMAKVAPRLVKSHVSGIVEALISEDALRKLEEAVLAEAGGTSETVGEAVPVAPVATEIVAGAVDIPGLCLCGCGQGVAGKKRKFRPGHDAKLHAIFRKIEKGELDESAIPEIARPHLSICTCCGQPILAHESGKGPVCRTGSCKCPNRLLSE